MLRYRLPDCKEENSSWNGVLDDAAYHPQALGGSEHGPSDVLGCFYHLLEGLAFVDGAIPVPGRDATSQEALDVAVVVFGENPGAAWRTQGGMP
jgi:hypothetical protein